MSDYLPANSQFLLYESEDGRVRIETRMWKDSVWLSMTQMATLFGIDKSGISRHLKNIFETEELLRDSVVANFATTAADGKTYQVDYYSLEAILAIGYRVNSPRGTQFRQWATERLKEYLVKGFVMDDERLKEEGGGTYFEELLERIRDIRSSEKVFWRKVLDIYATSIDYDPKSDISQSFFARVQNKMHWAAHGHTAAEVIHGRADASAENMGLTNWNGGRIRKSEIGVAKNYLTDDELNVLNRIVAAYLEVAELQALNRVPMHMDDWIDRLDGFLTMTGRDLLDHAGTVSREAALEKAREEHEIYRRHRANGITDVEKHFLETTEEINRIDEKRRKGGVS